MSSVMKLGITFIKRFVLSIREKRMWQMTGAASFAEISVESTIGMFFRYSGSLPVSLLPSRSDLREGLDSASRLKEPRRGIVRFAKSEREGRRCAGHVGERTVQPLLDSRTNYPHCNSG